MTLRQRTQEIYGSFFVDLAGAMGTGGSELGLGVTLFSLALSIRARNCVEIGRYKGFSGLAIAGALRLLSDLGWCEPPGFFERPGFDFDEHRAAHPRRLYSIDPQPTPEAHELWQHADVAPYIRRVDKASADVHFGFDITVPVDLLFVDGDHSYEGVLADVDRYWPTVRPGGFMVLHDYFGWYGPDGRNGSAVALVADVLAYRTKDGDAGYLHTSLLVDTGYPSFVAFRKPHEVES